MILARLQILLRLKWINYLALRGDFSPRNYMLVDTKFDHIIIDDRVKKPSKRRGKEGSSAEVKKTVRKTGALHNVPQARYENNEIVHIRTSRKL